MKYDRRNFLKFIGGTSTLLGVSGGLSVISSCNSTSSTFPSTSDELILRDGLSHKILISWGDRINEKESFGFNNDYTAFFPVSESEALLWVNHEYLDRVFVSGKERSKKNIDKERKEIGGSIIKIKKINNQWKFEENDSLNRRIDGTTKIPFSYGVKVKGSTVAEGTLGNCAGGITPWGTVLTCEEAYQSFYKSYSQVTGKEKKATYAWDKFYPNPTEHYGWVVEIDPKTGKAQKHVNIGRFAHECATCVSLPDGRVVVYSGDDKKDEHLYKFVSTNENSFEKGTLYVADTKNGKWLELSLNNPKLKNKFLSHLDILINPRKAAKIVGATPLDRPEDIEVDPLTGDIFVTLTNNKPKGNYFGQILKISESKKDYSSLTFSASAFKVGGKESGFACPDNLAFDRNGNLWFCSDIAGSAIEKGPYKGFGNNGLFVIPRSGDDAGKVIQVGSAPIDAELTGISFDSDFKTMFLSVQHPGEQTKDINKPTSHWPTGNMPKPSVVTIQGEFLDKLNWRKK